MNEWKKSYHSRKLGIIKIGENNDELIIIVYITSMLGA